MHLTWDVILVFVKFETHFWLLQELLVFPLLSYV